MLTAVGKCLDVESNRKLLARLLQTQQLRCDLAENGQVALETVLVTRDRAYHIVFMDNMMPVMVSVIYLAMFRLNVCTLASFHVSRRHCKIITVENRLIHIDFNKSHFLIWLPGWINSNISIARRRIPKPHHRTYRQRIGRRSGPVLGRWGRPRPLQAPEDRPPSEFSRSAPFCWLYLQT